MWKMAAARIQFDGHRAAGCGHPLVKGLDHLLVQILQAADLLREKGVIVAEYQEYRQLMSFPFVIAHVTDGRTRIRWAGETADKDQITDIAAGINELPAVDWAEARTASGSIIIEHHAKDWKTLQSQLTESQSLEFIIPPARQDLTGIQALNQGLEKINGGMKSVNADLPSLTVFLLTIMAITQGLRGQVMGNAVSFLWYAMSIAMMSRNSTQGSMQGTD